MNYLFKIFFLFLLIPISFCSNNRGDQPDPETKGDLSKADKVKYSFHASSVAPQYYRGYTISVTPEELRISVNSYGDTLLTKSRTFTKEKFEEVMEKFKNLKKSGEIDERNIPDGGTSTSITFYKGNKILFEASDYGADNKDFKGADIDLTYLVPDLQDLIDSTKDKEKQNSDN